MPWGGGGGGGGREMGDHIQWSHGDSAIDYHMHRYSSQAVGVRQWGGMRKWLG